MDVLSVPFFMGQQMAGFDVPVPHDTLDPSLGDSTPQLRMATIYRDVAAWVENASDPVVYSGDCVTILGVLAGLQRRGVDPTLYFFDAHGDFHTWTTTGSDFIGGMPLAMATGRGEQTIVQGAGMAPLADTKVVLVDGRDLDPGEDSAVFESGIAVASVAEVVEREPEPGPLYVHVDVDVVDPLDMPAVNYPAPGGPRLAEVERAVRVLADSGRVAAFSISSWNPALPGADIAAVATRSIAAPFLGG